MSDKKTKRLRRARKSRLRMQKKGVHRLCVLRTPKHIYAQVISPDGSQTLASASTLEADVRGKVGNGGNSEAARIVGTRIAEKAIKAKIKQVAFDRSGHKFHGRVKALAEAAREAGMTI